MRREVERHRRYAALSRSDEFGYRTADRPDHRRRRRLPRRDARAGRRHPDRDPRPRPQPRRAPLPGAGLAGPTGRPARSCCSSTPSSTTTAADSDDRARRRRPGRPGPASGVGAGPPGPAAGPVGVDELPPARRAARQGHRVRPRRRRRPDPARPGWPGSRGMGPMLVQSLAELLGHARRHPATGHRPRPGRSGSTATSTATTLKDHGLAAHRRRRVPLHAPHRHPRRRRLRPRQGLRPRRATGPDRHPQLRARCAGDITAGRPTAATAADRPAPAATCGRPPTGSASSSTTPAPTDSTPTAAELILTAPPGVDVYVPDARLDYQPTAVDRELARVATGPDRGHSGTC